MKKIKKKALFDESKEVLDDSSELNQEVGSYEEAKKIIMEEYIKGIYKFLTEPTKAK